MTELNTTYAAAISSVIVCLSISSLLAIGFLLVFFFSTIQIVRLWFGGSKISHRKRVFLRLVACNLTRFIWYTVSAYHLLPENFDEKYISLNSGIFPFLTSRFS